VIFLLRLLRIRKRATETHHKDSIYSVYNRTHIEKMLFGAFLYLVDCLAFCARLDVIDVRLNVECFLQLFSDAECCVALVIDCNAWLYMYNT